MDNEFRTISLSRVRSRLEQLGFTEDFEYSSKIGIAVAWKESTKDGKQILTALKIDVNAFECVEVDTRGTEQGKWVSCNEKFKGLASPAKKTRAKRGSKAPNAGSDLR